MPINAANEDVRKNLEEITEHSVWLNAEIINEIFDTEAEKKQLSDLREMLVEATKKNEVAADAWQKIGMAKEVALKLLRKTVGIPI